MPGTNPTDAMHLRMQAFLPSLNEGRERTRSDGSIAGKEPRLETVTDSNSLSTRSMVPPDS